MAIEDAVEETVILRRMIFRTRKALFDRAPYPEPWPIHRPFGPVDSGYRAPDYTDEEILSADWLTEEEWLAC